MRKICVEIDERLIEEARILLGTESTKDTINSALREVVHADARRQELRALAESDGLDLAHEEVMSKAWRT